MTDDRSRQNRRPQRQQFLPDIYTDVPMWLQSLLQEMKSRIEAIYVDPNPPAQPTGVTVTQAFPGMQLRWNRVRGADRYLVFRSTTATFETATIVAVLPYIDNVSVFDITQSLPAGSTLTYWVVAENSAGVRGPLSAMAQSAISTPPVPGTVTTEDTTFGFINGDPDMFGDGLGLAGGDIGSDSVAMWAYIEDDDDFFVTSNLTGFKIP